MSDQNAKDLLIKKQLIDDILDSEDGVVKRASAATSKATRTQIREEGFQRAIMSFDMITNEELDYFGDSELPGVWFELEPDSPPARIIPYNDTPNTFAYRAEKYVVLISVITTEEATKNVNHLRTYKTDIRQIVNDNMLRDIHTAEDTAFLAEVDRLVGSPVAYGTVEAAIVAGGTGAQNVTMGTATFSRANLKRAVSYLIERQLPVGVFLVNQRTANEFLGWDRNEMGGDLSQEVARKGLKALETFEMFGIPFISTIKNNLVANGVMYQFAPREFLGNALMLEDITVTIKKEYDIIRMRAQEQVGLTIGNPLGLQKLNYTMSSVTGA
jgi:hypothetical protein